MRLRADEVFVHVNAAGAPDVQNGRVQVRYRVDAVRAYNAALRNLLPVGDTTVYPESHCATIDEATVAPTSPAPLFAPDEHSPTQSSTTTTTTKTKKPARHRRVTAPVSEPDSADTSTPTDRPSGRVIAYADGACTGNPGPSGLGLVVLDGLRRIERSEYLGHGTNNVAELTAILRALEASPDGSRPLAIHTDSQYSIGVLSKGWKPKRNQTLIAEIKVVLARRGAVSLHYVHGHSGIPLNERADALARDAVRARETVEIVLAETPPATPPAEETAHSSIPKASRRATARHRRAAKNTGST